MSEVDAIYVPPKQPWRFVWHYMRLYPRWSWAFAALMLYAIGLIQNSLDDIMADETVLVLAHRLSTLTHLDRIVVLDKGLIVEDGCHQQLIELRDLYYRLWHHQSEGLLSESDALKDGLLVNSHIKQWLLATPHAS